MTDHDLRILAADLDDPRIVTLLETHARAARAQTAPGSAHALDLSSLRAADISVWVAWIGNNPVGVGALKSMNATESEIKSMFTASEARRQGVARALLSHLLSLARSDGLSRVSLETGSWPYFEPARALYTEFGFRECSPFGNYRDDPNSKFMTFRL